MRVKLIQNITLIFIFLIISYYNEFLGYIAGLFILFYLLLKKQYFYFGWSLWIIVMIFIFIGNFRIYQYDVIKQLNYFLSNQLYLKGNLVISEPQEIYQINNIEYNKKSFNQIKIETIHKISFKRKAMNQYFFCIEATPKNFGINTTFGKDNNEIYYYITAINNSCN